ncbi:MAG: LpqB family beta-propeller domain-containing protein [Propionibacteriaceae bacterium]|nr:LpqB family beta-propeller domain-containing protein [Propionibacteriaceae bacterium]
MMRRVALLLAVMMALTGCTSIATSGPVEEVPLAAQPRGIDIAPEPPSLDMTPERLVEGFLQALADPEGGYAIARQYLSADVAASWDPVEARVFDGEVLWDEGSARLIGHTIGGLDASHRYSAHLEPLEHDFGLVQEQGQWRISKPSDGLLLSRFNFERYYSRVTLYFLSRVGAHVVPDPIHLPESHVTPSNILASLFTGPSDDIARAVLDAVPRGTRLGPQGATIDQAGVVTVDLAGMPAELSDDALRRLGAQLLWTLTSTPRFTGLTVIQGGRTLPIPGTSANGVLELATQQGYQVLSRAAATDLYGVRRGRAGRISGSNLFSGLAGAPQRASDVAVSVDGASIAILSEDRTQVFTGGIDGPVAPLEVPLSNLRSPQFVLGDLWLLGDDWMGRPRLMTVDRAGSAQFVNVEGDLGRMQDFAVSPSRARVAIVAEVDGAPTLGIAAVSGVAPAVVAGWHPLTMVSPTGELLTDPVSPAWQAETSLAVAASAATGRSVFTTMLDGALVQDLGGMTGAVVDLAANVRLGGGPIAVTNSQGVVWRYEARTRWTRIVEDISAVAYPG